MTAFALEQDHLRPTWRDRRTLLFVTLTALLVLVSLLGLGLGATGVPLSRVLAVMADAVTGHVATGAMRWSFCRCACHACCSGF